MLSDKLGDTILDFIESLKGKETLIVQSNQLFPVMQIVEQFFDRFLFMVFLMLFSECIRTEWSHVRSPGVCEQCIGQFFMFTGQMLPAVRELIPAVTLFQLSPGAQGFNQLREKDVVQGNVEQIHQLNPVDVFLQWILFECPFR